MKTHLPKHDEIERSWHLFDASKQPLGRLATEVASLLIGKHRADYTSHMDMGDFVVVTNAQETQVSGKKAEDKMYHRHSGHPGGIASRTFTEQMEHDPTSVIRLAVRGMLPKNRLQSGRLNRLKIYAGAEHEHGAQIPSE